MSAFLTEEIILVAVLSGIASLGIGIWANRREIARIEDQLWGPERSTGEGIEGTVDSLCDQVGRIEAKIDDESAARREDHEHVEAEIRLTREMLVETRGSLIDTLTEEIDGFEIDRYDVEPDYGAYTTEPPASEDEFQNEAFED